MSAKNYWFAFGVGVTAGAAIALLYAPQKGVVTRRRLRKSVDEAGDYLEDAADYLKEQAERLAHEAQKAYKTGVSQVSDYADKAQDLAKNAAKTVTSLV